MSAFAKLTCHGSVAVISIDNPPVNALSPGVAEAIQEGIRHAVQNPEVRSIVIIGAGRTFIAGADIRELGKFASGERPASKLNALVEDVEYCPKPVVMAIHGTAFGGGLETAMAGHYRVIAPSAQVGQPETKLGLIPGGGGTQRLPRLAGVAKAVEMCAFGEPIKAPEALALGIVDSVIEGDLLQGAITFAHEAADKPFRRTRDRNEKLAAVHPTVFVDARDQALKTKRGQTAPLAAIDAVEAATMLCFDAGCERERDLFEQCLASTQSKAMIHAFFGERLVGKIPNIPKNTEAFEIRRAAVVGAGTMGGGIAMVYANAGIPVIVKETMQEALDRGMVNIRSNYASSVKKGRLSQREMENRLALITPQLGYEGFQEADIITEAVFENAAIKKQVISEIDKVAKSTCILASNTSSLNIDELASAASCPHKVIGTHFFSPANVMRLLEVVPGKASSKEVIQTCMGLGRQLGKVAVLAGNCRGFIGNRMLAPYMREAQFLVEEGASVEAVNQALYDFGMPMGPLAMGDLIGLDVSYLIRKEFREAEKPGTRKPLVPDLLFELGRFGQKSGRGWSKYDANRNASPDAQVNAMIEETARKANIPRRQITAQEIIDRCIFALVNEGARLLEEGVALRAVDIDIVYLFGYGFPAWRGGPMYYADSVGLGKVLTAIDEFRSVHGPDLWSPAPLLKRLAESGSTFEGSSEMSR